MFSVTQRRRLAVTLTVAISGVFIAGCGGSSQPKSPGPSQPSAAAPIAAPSPGWSTLLDGPSHYGASGSIGPQTATVRWHRALGAPIVAGPVVSAGGTTYVSAENGVLRAIDVQTGKQRWAFDGGGSYGGEDLSTSALILPSGEILWPGPRDQLFALSADGKLLWTLSGVSQLLTPVVDQATRLLVLADLTGHISGYRLTSPTRRPTKVWSRRLSHESFGNPVVAADGTIYQTSGDCLFALSPSGQVRWSVTTPAAVEVSPAIAVNGIVVFGSNNRKEYGVDPNGHVRWTEKIGNYTYSSPVTLPGRRVVFGNHSAQITILDSDTGQVLRRDTGAGEIWTSAAVDSRGDVYFATRTGQIYGFGAGGHRLFDLDAGGKFDSYPALSQDGTLLVGGDNGTLYAIGHA
jgi:outer membrane protein assembly factor BamB